MKRRFCFLLGMFLASSAFAATSFTPGDLEGLALWLDADDVETLRLEEESGRVLAWLDKSGEGNTAVPVEDLEPPVYAPDELNGCGLVRFDGRNALRFGQSESLDFQGEDDLTVFAVLNARSNGSILARTDGRRMQYRFHVPRERTLRVVFGRGESHIDTTSTIDTHLFSLLSVINADHGGTQRFELFVDGQKESGGPTGSGRVEAETILGARDDGTRQNLSFDLAELIVVRQAISESERREVEQYLTKKFGLDDQEIISKKLPKMPEDAFTVAVIPDTQRYHGPGSGRGDESGETRNPAFDSRTIWLSKNIESERIVFVTHMGDIVDRNNHHQWRVARENMDRFHGRVPYGISVGNHDMVNDTGDSSLFQEYFGAERYADKLWYGGTYEGHPEHGPAVSGNNANSYQLFSEGGLDFLIVHVECNAPKDVLEWVDEVMEAHRDRMAIIVTHMYLGGLERRGSDEPQGRMLWKKVHGERGTTPQQMWEKSFSKHPNLFMVLCGDQSLSISHHQESQGTHGNTVHEILTDYPRPTDDSDWLRLLRFHPEEGKIRVWTYSPAQDMLCDGIRHLIDPRDHQFTLDISGAIDDHLAQRENVSATNR